MMAAEIHLNAKQRIMVLRDGRYHYTMGKSGYIVHNFIKIPKIIVDGKEVPFECVLEYEDDNMRPQDTK